MTSKLCTKCKSNVAKGDIFCGNCGARQEEYEPIKESASSKELPALGFWGTIKQSFTLVFRLDWFFLFQILFGKSEYSVSRAKWLYEASENLLNLIVIVSLIAIGIYGLFNLLILLSVIPLFFAQLGTDIVAFGEFLGSLILVKLILMAIGSVIRIAELSEK